MERDAAEPRLVHSTDGTPIAYWSVGEGPPLLLVHGAMSDHRRWRIVEKLGRHRRVHAMDRRGRGGSGDADQWSLQRETEDVLAVVDTLAGSGEPVDVLGHSLGGLLALRAASQTSQIRCLVLYEPAVVELAQPPETLARMRSALAAGLDDEVVEIMMRDVVQMSDDEIAALRAMPSWPARVATAATLPRELSVDLVWDPSDAARVGARVLVIQGGESPEIMQRGCRLVADSIPGARLVVLEGQRHVADQIAPDDFARVVLDFLAAPG